MLHFTDIAQYSEQDYLDKVLPHINDPYALAPLMLRDIHHMSVNILAPKFFWIKVSYVSFVLGNGLALITLGLWGYENPVMLPG